MRPMMLRVMGVMIFRAPAIPRFAVRLVRDSGRGALIQVSHMTVTTVEPGHIGVCYKEAMRRMDSILEEALQLPEDERARVALRLSESLSGTPDANAVSAWAHEITRRIERLRDGSARTVTTDEALSRARAHLATRRA